MYEVLKKYGLKVHNIFSDYVLPDGRNAHRVWQIIDGLFEKATDEAIVAAVKGSIEEGSRICTIFEVDTECTLSEFEDLVMSPRILFVSKRCVYEDPELVAEYMREAPVIHMIIPGEKCC